MPTCHEIRVQVVCSTNWRSLIVNFCPIYSFGPFAPHGSLAERGGAKILLQAYGAILVNLRLMACVEDANVKEINQNLCCIMIRQNEPVTLCFTY